MMKKAAIVVFAWCYCVSSFAQENPALLNFTGFQYKDSVLIRFTMRGGFSCNGIDIQRSPDSILFSTIGDIQGVCGSPGFDVPFEFTDISPFKNADNFYRLDLKNYGYSQIINVRFTDFNITGYSFFPNPCKDGCKLYFENSTNAEVEFYLFNVSGKLIDKRIFRGTEVSLNTKNLSQGIYFYTLFKNSGEPIIGNFVVL